MSESTPSTSTADEAEEIFPRRKRGRPSGAGKHPVHELFNYSEEQKESRCLVAGCKRVEVPGRHAGNLMAHLKSHHKDVHKTVKAECEKADAGGSTAKQPRLQSALLNGVKMSGEALQLHCIRLVTESGLAFAALDYPAMQDIIRPMVDAMPAAERVTISSRALPPKIHQFADKVRQQIASETEGQMVSIKVDGCTKNHRYFVGINIQFAKNFTINFRTLAVEELHLAATANNLRVLIGMVLKRFRITPKQVVSFTSDSGANYVLAGKLLGEDLGFQFEGENDDGWIDSTMELRQDDFNLSSVRCAEHTLQLAIGDALKAETGLNPTIDALRALAKFLLTETQARQIKDAGLPLPVLEVCSRWGSRYDMAKSVHRLKPFLTHTFVWGKKSDQQKYDLSEEAWAMVEMFLNDLRPLRKATIQLQKQDLTLGEFYGIWTGVKLALEKREGTLPKALVAAMDKRAKATAYSDKTRGDRLSPLFHYPAFNAAVFMDPRFFSLLSPEQVEEAKLFLLNLWDRLQAVRRTADCEEDKSKGTDDDTDADDPQPAEEDEDDDATSLFAKLLQQRNRERVIATGASTSTSSEVTRKQARRAALRALLDQHDRETVPLAAKEDVVKYWERKKLIVPDLADLALIVLSIPATQVSVERLFSALRFILRPQRFGLGPEHVDDVAFLNANAEVTREVVQQCLKKKKKVPAALAVEGGSGDK